MSGRSIPAALCNSPILVILSFAAGLILSTLQASPSDGDWWWQRWLGTIILQQHAIPSRLGVETFTAVGAPWVAHEWLFSTALAAAISHGAEPVFAFLIGSCALAALVIVALSSLRGGATVVGTSAAVSVALIGIIPSLGLRAQVVAWVFMAAFFAIIREPHKRWQAVPLTVAWANLHASALLAPATIALLLTSDLLDRRRIDRRSLQLTGLLLATTAAVFVTPLGWQLPAYAINLIGSPIKAYIVEWQSPVEASANGLLFLVAVAVLLVIGCNQRRHPLDTFERLTLLAYFGLATSAVRHLPVFYLFALPMAAATNASPRSLRKTGTGTSKWMPIGLAVLVFPIGVIISTAALSRRSELPYGAVRFVVSHAANTRIFCSNYSWCGMLVGEQNVRVYLDGRADPYPPELWQENMRVLAVREAVPILQRRRVNVIMVAVGEPLDLMLAKSKGWSVAFRDAKYVLYRLAPGHSSGAG